MKNMKLFQDMEIKEEIKSAIKKMGFEEATPIQAEGIPAILTGKDFIGIAQTGTGKTCAFGVPAIQQVDTSIKATQVLILCPTRELVMQTGKELQQLSQDLKSIKIATIYGGQQIQKQFLDLRKKPQIIVGTPGRIMDHMRRKTINFENISMFILDEADEMLNMGFREDLNVILEKANEERQTVLLSATMSKDIMNITKKYQKADAIKVEIERKELTAPKIKQYMIGVQENKKLDVLTRILEGEEIKLAVVFCNTKRKVDELQESFRLRGYEVEALHGDMKQSQRDMVMKRFRSGKARLLIATDIAARGIDVDSIEMIFNYDIPSEEEYYVHRIGRTGRAGKEGRAITFASPKERYKIRQIQKYAHVILEDFKVPSAKSINDKKMNNLLDKITKEITASDLTREKAVIENYLETTSLDLIDFAAVLLKMKTNHKKLKEITKEITSVKSGNSSSKGASKGNVRLFLTIGKMDGMKRNSLRDFVCKNTGISKNSILDSKILDKFSFLTLSERNAAKVMRKLDGTTYNDRRIAVEFSQEKK